MLGEGAVGEVWEVIHKQTQELFAVKKINKHQAKLVSRNIKIPQQSLNEILIVFYRKNKQMK